MLQQHQRAVISLPGSIRNITVGENAYGTGDLNAVPSLFLSGLHGMQLFQARLLMEWWQRFGGLGGASSIGACTSVCEQHPFLCPSACGGDTRVVAKEPLDVSLDIGAA